jgi:hypothetical protein
MQAKGIENTFNVTIAENFLTLEKDGYSEMVRTPNR